MDHKIGKEELVHRLNRISGQIGGIKRMVEEDRECPDLLMQIAAARAALAKLGMIITEDHLEHCVAGAYQKGNLPDSILSLSKAMKQMLK